MECLGDDNTDCGMVRLVACLVSRINICLWTATKDDDGYEGYYKSQKVMIKEESPSIQQVSIHEEIYSTPSRDIE